MGRRRCVAAIAGALLVAALGAAGCSGLRDAEAALTSDEAKAREARLTASLADSGKSGDEPVALWLLPNTLREISGVALSGNGRMFAHGDERGVVWEVDHRRGIVLKRFTVGEKAITVDLEGIAIVNNRFFLLQSNGTIYEFREGASGEHVPYTTHDPKLAKECEFEGIAYDPAINSLLLACKNILQKSLDNGLLIYRWRLEGAGAGISQLSVPWGAVIGDNDWKKLRPSDIAVDPQTGNYVLVSAQEQGLVVITPAGEVLQSRALPTGHAQPEGLAITKDNILILGDEAGTGAARITLYRWP